ncbi:MAG: DNA polymerase III subunit delta [Candidatus Brocadiia bacterium]
MPKVKALRLEQHLEESGPAPAYGLHGDDEALLARGLNLLLHTLVPDDQPGGTVRTFREAPEPAAVFDELRTIPFMGMEGRRVVVVEDGDAFAKDNADRIAAYLERPAESGILILCFDRADFRTKAVKAIASAGVMVDCSRVRWRDAENWVRSRARELGKKITPRAASALVEALGPNLMALGNELEKLVLFCEPEDTVDMRAVEEAGVRGREQSIFELGTAVSQGDGAEATKLCERLLLRGEALEAIIAVLARQVRNLWQIKRLKQDGASQNQIAGKLGLPSFVVRRDLRTAAGLPDRWFRERLSALSEADYELKTTSLRSGEERVWVESLVARLCEG